MILAARNEEQKGSKYMNITDLEKSINILEMIKNKGYPVNKVGVSDYRVVPCPSCGSKKGMTINADNNYFNCFACNTGGKAYKWLTEIEGLEESEAKRELEEMNGNIEKSIKKVPSIPTKKTTAQPRTDWEPVMDLLYHNLAKNEEGKKALEYLFNRGISSELIDKYFIGYGNIENEKGTSYKNVIVFPIRENGNIVTWISRTIDDNQENKYYNNTGGMKLFNGDLLKEKDQDIFITESIIDALSLESIGIKAIALCGVNQIKLFKERAKKENRFNKYYDGLDNDQAGKKASKELQDFLKNNEEIGIYQETNLFQGTNYKDINEFLTKDKAGLEKALDKSLGDKNSVEYYIKHLFAKDIALYQEGSKITTGIDPLDKHLNGLHSGLYVIGGVTGAGKTTLAHQIADNLAFNGHKVVYLSLEQSKFDITAKSLTREAYQNYNADLCIHNIKNIKANNQKNKKIIKEAIQSYTGRLSGNMEILEGNFNLNLKSIQDYLQKYIQVKKERPILFIDYLQILPPYSDKLSDKQNVDVNVTELKRMSRDLKIPVVVISSVSRDNYTQDLNYSSFKETGGIEYTADVLIALQLEIVTSSDYLKLKTKADQYKALKDYQEQTRGKGISEVNAKILKNRFGNKADDISLFFNWKRETFEFDSNPLSWNK